MKKITLSLVTILLLPLLCFAHAKQQPAKQQPADQIKEISGLNASYYNKKGSISFIKFIGYEKSIPRAGKYDIELVKNNLIISKNKSEKFRVSDMSFLNIFSDVVVKDFNLTKEPEYKLFFNRITGALKKDLFNVYNLQFLCGEGSNTTFDIDSCLRQLYFHVNWSEFEGENTSMIFKFVNGILGYKSKVLGGSLTLNSLHIDVKNGDFTLSTIIEKKYRPVVVVKGHIEKTANGLAIKIKQANRARISFKKDIYKYLSKANYKNIKVVNDTILVNLK